jgi:hypothetical protein
MHVCPRSGLGAVFGGKDVLVEDYFRVPGIHGCGDVGEDGAGEVVGPVVEDIVEEVGACAWRVFALLSVSHIIFD